MRNRMFGILLAFLIITSAFAAEPPKIRVGDMAPDFTLLQYDGEKLKPVSLHEFKGKKQVALAFYVFAFTGG